MSSRGSTAAALVAVALIAIAPVVAAVPAGEAESGTQVIIDGGEAEGTEPYVIEVRGEVEKSNAGGRASINGGDSVRDGAVVGRVHEGSDAYRIQGNITGFVVHGPATVTVDGERVEPSEVAPKPVRPNILFVSGREQDGRADYSVTVAGDVGRSEYRRASINRRGTGADSVSGGRIEGTVTGGADAYRFGGWLTALQVDGPATVEVNDQHVDPATVGAPPGETTTIDSCGIIDSPGRYVLASNVTHSDKRTCIHVVASDVVLDGNGHRLGGVGANDSTAVAVDDEAARRSNVTVRDLSVTGWSTGISVGRGGEGVDRVAVENVTAQGNGVGVDLQQVSAAAVVRSAVTDNGGTGIRTNEFDHLFLRRNRVADNGGYGSTVFYGRRATITNNVLADNGAGGGFSAPGLLLEDVSRVRVTENAVRHSAGAGVEVSMVYGGNVSRNDLDRNDGAGLTGSDLTDLALTDNRVRQNGAEGIAVWTGSNLVITDNYLAYNDGEALKLENVENSTVANNTVEE